MRQVPLRAVRPFRRGLCSWLVLPVALAMLAGAGGGCVSQEIADGPEFPVEKPVKAVLDVHVIRDGTEIRMTNTSSRSFGRCRVWANRWWSRELEGFRPGETVTLGLSSFKDKFGDEFRAGGFFATENPETLVKLEIEEGEEMVGLIVIGE